MPPAGFEPAIAACERQQTNALERAFTAIGNDRMISKLKHDFPSVFHLLRYLPYSAFTDTRCFIEIKDVYNS
jgi:hypothetical protein